MDGNYNHENKNNCSNYFTMKVINALVTFEKGDSLKARFTFELSCDNDMIIMIIISIQNTTR